MNSKRSSLLIFYPLYDCSRDAFSEPYLEEQYLRLYSNRTIVPAKFMHTIRKKQSAFNSTPASQLGCSHCLLPGKIFKEINKEFISSQ